MNYFDLHCDTPIECYKRSVDFNDAALAVSARKGEAFERWYQCFAVFIREDNPLPYEYYQTVLCEFKNKLKSKSDNLTPIFTVEGGTVIEDDISRIKQLKDDGIRALTLTWNGENNIASGALCEGGLKPFGKEVIIELNRNRIATDLAHINREGYFDALEAAEFPIITHTCCDSFHSHKRNVTDEQVRALVQKNGVIGLCFYPEFLGCGNVFENVYKNIFLLLDKGYEDNIAIGSDFDGATMDDELKDISFVPTLYSKLKRFGISADILNKIFFENSKRFFDNL